MRAAAVAGDDVDDRTPERRAVAMIAAAKADGLLAALWSPTEVCVDPREIISKMPAWLEKKWGVELRYETPVAKVDAQGVTTADGSRVLADKVVDRHH